MPAKDEREIHRLNEQHFAIKEELGGNYAAPISNLAAILDIGCGTGRWALEMAVDFPQARVTGLDIIMPDPADSLGLGIDTLPPNVTFVQADATQPLPFPDAAFAYVRLSLLYAVIPAGAWEHLTRECARITQSGGWVESVEAAPFSNPSERSGMRTITLWFIELLRHRGAEPFVALKMPAWMQEAGLTNVFSREITESATKGDQQEAISSAEALIDYLRDPVVAAGIASSEHYETIAAQALAEVRYTSKGSGFNTYVTYGQRGV